MAQASLETNRLDPSSVAQMQDFTMPEGNDTANSSDEEEEDTALLSAPAGPGIEDGLRQTS